MPLPGTAGRDGFVKAIDAAISTIVSPVRGSVVVQIVSINSTDTRLSPLLDLVVRLFASIECRASNCLDPNTAEAVLLAFKELLEGSVGSGALVEEIKGEATSGNVSSLLAVTTDANSFNLVSYDVSVMKPGSGTSSGAGIGAGVAGIASIQGASKASSRFVETMFFASALPVFVGMLV